MSEKSNIRGFADDLLYTVASSPGPNPMQERALAGIGYAILHLADAIAESKSAPGTADELAAALMEGARFVTERHQYGSETSLRA